MKTLIRKTTPLAIVLAAMLILSAAAPAQAVKTSASTGDAAYHYSIGTKLALDGVLPEAAKEYETALQLDQIGRASCRERV
jgi:hypothetical protein